MNCAGNMVEISVNSCQAHRASSVHRSNKAGFTLLELMIAFVIFSVGITAATQAMVSHFQLLSIQEQRVAAAQNCEGLLGEIRRTRDTLADAAPGAFPANLVAVWLDGWQTTAGSNRVSLTNEQLSITYVDADANPLQVRVTSSWADIRGRQAVLMLSTVVTDE